MHLLHNLDLYHWWLFVGTFLLLVLLTATQSTLTPLFLCTLQDFVPTLTAAVTPRLLSSLAFHEDGQFLLVLHVAE